MESGILQNNLITENQAAYSLKGMVNPTFQNEGLADVIIDGRLVKAGSSYGVYAPNHVLQNTINITFQGVNGIGQRKLYVAFVETI
ncbi:MAG: hypothetical protein H7Z76_06015 [Methylotenera sp.]|nr:hypothetical protein [Flavobacterium sp.]